MKLDTLSAIPEASRADVLHGAYKINLLDSLIKLVSYVASAFGEDYPVLLNTLARIRLQPPAFISPRLYSVYFELLTSINQDDIAKVREIIALLKNADESFYFIPRRLVQPGLTEEWEHHVFVDEVKAAFGSDVFMATSPSEHDLHAFKTCVATTLKLIESADPIFFTEISALVATIQLVNSELDVGATSPKFFGSIYISLPQGNLKAHETLLVADQLIHETSHLYLNTIIPYDPLILNDADERFDSPLRSDLRPMLGLYHAAFVLSRVIRVFKKIAELNLYKDPVFVNKCIENLIEKYEISYATVKTQGVLTPVGKRIFESTRECAFLV